MKLNEWWLKLVPGKAANRLLKDTGMRNPWIRKTAFVIDQMNSDYFSNIFKNSKASNTHLHRVLNWTIWYLHREHEGK